MKAFNGLLVLLLGIGLALSGALVLGSALGLGGLGGDTFQRSLQTSTTAAADFLQRAGSGGLTVGEQAALWLLVLAGLVLLVLELRPSKRHLIPLGEGAFVLDRAAEHAIEQAASLQDATLGAEVDVDAKRTGLGAVKVHSQVRPGTDSVAIRERIEESVANALKRLGIEAARIDVSVDVTDPRRAKARVR